MTEIGVVGLDDEWGLQQCGGECWTEWRMAALEAVSNTML